MEPPVEPETIRTGLFCLATDRKKNAWHIDKCEVDYKSAWKLGVKLVQAMKPDVQGNRECGAAVVGRFSLV
jgi:hypothetical protein